MPPRAQASERRSHWLECEVLDHAGDPIEVCPVAVETIDGEGCVLRHRDGGTTRVRNDEWYVSPDRRWRCRLRVEGDEGLLAANPDGIARELVITNGRGLPSRVVRVPPNVRTVTIGRSPAEADIVIADRKVSALHARMLFEGSEVRVHDLGSRNGLTVNGAAASGSVTLGGEGAIGVGLNVVSLRDPWHQVAAELARVAPRQTPASTAVDRVPDSNAATSAVTAVTQQPPPKNPEDPCRTALPSTRSFKQPWVIYVFAVVGISCAMLAAMCWLA